MKVLNYKGKELFLCTWSEKPCIMASQISEVLRTPGRSVAEVIRNNPIFKKSEDYSVLKNDDAKEFRNQIKEAGKDRFFAAAIVIYKCGIEKYITHMKFSSISNEIRDLSIFLSKERIIDTIIEPQHKTISINPEQRKESFPELPEYKQKLMLELYECVKGTPIPPDVKAKFLIDILENRISDSIGLLKKWLIDLKVYIS